MGGVSLDGSFVSGNAMQIFIEKQFMDNVETGYDPYGGGFGTIDTFRELNVLRKSNGKYEPDYRLKEFMKLHPEYKTKDEIFSNYLDSRLCDDSIDKWEVEYIIDYSSPCGYEIVTYGGRQELHIRNLRNIPESWIDSLSPKKKGYKVFTVGTRSTLGRRSSCTFDTLKEIEDAVRKDVVRYSQTYFILKNDCSKIYVIKPNIKVVKTTTKENSYKDDSYRVNKRYPIYYAGIAGC